MSGFASDYRRNVVMVAETTPGTPNLAATGQIMRRTSCNFTLTGQKITNDEIRASNQPDSWFLGARQTSGTLSGYLSCGSYAMIFEGLFRSKFAAAPQAVNLVKALFVVEDGTPYIFTTGINLMQIGFRIGDIVQAYGDEISSANQVSFLVKDVTPNSMALFGGDLSNINNLIPLIISSPGYKLIIPHSGQSLISYSIEHQYYDVERSELFTGCYVNAINISASPTSFVKFSAQFIGIAVLIGSSPVFSSLAAPLTTVPLSCNGGFLVFNGEIFASVTSFSLSITAPTMADPRVGSDYLSQIFAGQFLVSGQISAFLSFGDILSAGFFAESTFQLTLLLTDSSRLNANFIRITLPSVKLTDLSPSDSANALVRTYKFQGLEQTSNPALDLSTIVIQDSIGPFATAETAGWVFGVSAFGTGSF